MTRCMPLSGGIPRIAGVFSHLVAKLHCTALVGLHFHQMECDVPLDLLEEWDSITNQDRKDRIAHFVGEPETKAFGRDRAASNKPNAVERGSQVLIHELRKVA